ncbi:MAG: hypothetical protein EXS39_03115 [Opitutaceae bacterium]|nr:hypothetical protein [Opitutaceae bacterium]
MSPFFRPLAVGLLGLAGLHAAAATKYQVTVASADADRAGQVVVFALPSELARGALLHDAAGHLVPLQIESDRTARFLIAAQPAGQTIAFALEEGVPPLTSGVRVVEEPSVTRGQAAGITAATDSARAVPRPGRLRLSVEGIPILYYRMDKHELPRDAIDPKFERSGYLHPVLTPSGQMVTDDYPAHQVHDHGIWSPWAKTKFQGRAPDFWNMGEKTGTVEFGEIDRTWTGAVHGGFTAWHRFLDLSAPAPVVALNETWEVTVYGLPATAVPVRMFDLVIRQTCATSDPLLLSEFPDGGLGFRGAAGWNGPGDAAHFLTSEGETDRSKGNNTRVRWCYLGGAVAGGDLAGSAILGHPDNFRAPQPVRVHPNLPFLCFAPSQLGDFPIEPGKPFVARYRFIVADGAPNRALLDAFWNAYAKPAVVRVEAL